MLSRPVYKGMLSNAGKIVKGLHDPIIDVDTWETVQKEVKKRKEGITPLGEYLLTGLLKCGNCGGNVVHVKRVTKRGDKVYDYELYACASQHVRGKDLKTDVRCRVGYLSREKVEAYVVSQIKAIAVHPEKFIAKLNENKLDHDENKDNGLEQLQLQLEKINTSLENLYDAIQNGDIKASAVSDRIKKLEEQAESIENDMDDIIDASDEVIDSEAALILMKEIGESWDSFTEQEQKVAVKKIIKNVIFRGKKGPLTIDWNYE